MLKLRRSSYPIRVEMTPLIDVIFLLLTFFIYSLVVTVQAQIMPVSLTPMTGKAAPDVSHHDINAITINREGRIFFNQVPVAASDIPGRLTQFAARQGHGTLFIAMEDQGDTDRGPLLIFLIQQLRQAGITDVAIVGQPSVSKTGRHDSIQKALKPDPAGPRAPTTSQPMRHEP